MCLMNFMIIRAQIELINRLAYASFSFKNGNVSAYGKKDEKKSKKHLTKREVFGNIDEHC